MTNLIQFFRGQKSEKPAANPKPCNENHLDCDLIRNLDGQYRLSCEPSGYSADRYIHSVESNEWCSSTFGSPYYWPLGY